MENYNQNIFTLLYIGGDNDIIKQLQEYNQYFDVVVADHGLLAVNILKEQADIDAIIAEDILPGMDAISIFKMIKTKHLLPETPFLIVLHENKPQLIKKAILEHIDDVYTLPLDPEKLHTRIKFLKTFKKTINTQQDQSKPIREYKIPFIKRAFDILVSGFALMLLSPLFLLVIFAIKLESKGSVFYTSKRVGTGYRIFDFYKFRSMFIGADARLKELKHLNKYAKAREEENIKETEDLGKCPRCAKLGDGSFCSPTLFYGGEKICEYWYHELKKSKPKHTFTKIVDDPRITTVGKIIRNTSIDELPQLFNVLKGDMSIVGNRPLPLYEAELLTSDDWSQRFLGPAGITGLWQVELRGKKGEMSEEERKALDNRYAQTYSFFGDIKLILRTIPALFQKESV